MRLRGIQHISSNVEIEVRPLEAYGELKRLILSKHGIDKNAYVSRDNKIVVDEDFCGSHRGTETTVIDENPTKEKLELMYVLDQFQLILTRSL